ncbi:MAG: amino acid ABC transporter ATP-binding protein, partial [Desulfobacteraceae bacterium]|nr:amino acid ABC transporter ATP-binding protein [Desulfobacteraceae bacterium]
MVKLTNIHKVFGKELHVLSGIDLEVHKGETVVILGASGSGKSTLLRCINFLEEPTAGTVEVDNIVVNAG